MLNDKDPLSDFSARERVHLQMMKNRLQGSDLKNRVVEDDAIQNQRRLERAKFLFEKGKINEGPIPQNEHPLYRTRYRRFCRTYLGLMDMYRNLED